MWNWHLLEERVPNYFSHFDVVCLQAPVYFLTASYQSISFLFQMDDTLSKENYIQIYGRLHFFFKNNVNKQDSLSSIPERHYQCVGILFYPIPERHYQCVGILVYHNVWNCLHDS